MEPRRPPPRDPRAARAASGSPGDPERSGLFARALCLIALAAGLFGFTGWLGGHAGAPKVARRSLVPALMADAFVGQAFQRAEPLRADHDIAHALFTSGHDEQADLARRSPTPSAAARVRSPERLDFRSPPLPNGAALLASREGAPALTTIFAGPTARKRAAAWRASTPELAAHGAAHPVRGPPAHRLS